MATVSGPWEPLLTSRPRVLVVDDEPDFVEVIEDHLMDHELDLRSASDPEVAMKRLGEAPADVLLVDLQMPKGGGRRLLAEVARHHPDAACVVVTAWGSEAVAVEMLKDLGAVGYVSKVGIDEDKLVRAISEARMARRASQVAARRELVIGGVVEGVKLTLYPFGYLTAQPELRRLTRLASVVDAARELGHREVRVDLRHLEACSAVALGHLLEAAQRLDAVGGRLEVAVAAAPRAVARVITSLERTAQRPGGLRVA